MKPSDIYVCSKPLQYFNIRNIRCDAPSGKKILIFMDYFMDARTFYERVKKYDHTWSDVLFFSGRFQVYRYIFCHHAYNLFVELDATFFFGVLHSLGCFKNMFMFEEGFGNYRTDRYGKPSHGLKKLIDRLTGVSVLAGESKFLTGEYLYLPDLYKTIFPNLNKDIRTFNKPFIAHLQDEIPFFLKLSDGYEDFLPLKDKRIGIYLTSHHIDSNFIDAIKKDSPSLDLMYIKLHPHIKNIDGLEQYQLKIIRSNIMIEFLLLILLNNGNKLTIYHDNSTSVIWFQDLIVNKNLGQRYEEYERVASYIRALKNK